MEEKKQKAVGPIDGEFVLQEIIQKYKHTAAWEEGRELWEKKK